VATLQSSGSEAVNDQIRDLAPWFHNLHLPDGEQTAPDHPLGDFPAFKWAEIGSAIPEDLAGCRALDIGCNAGFYSFELARRGADVLAIDHDPHYLRQAEWARSLYDVPGDIEFRQMGVYDVADLDEMFDLVLFLGVMYHLRYPLLALDIVASHTTSTLVLQTLTMPAGTPEGHTAPDIGIWERDRLLDENWPKMAFIEHHLASDHTNWWVPTSGAVEAMVRTTGLVVTARPGDEIWVCERRRESYHLAELHAATRRRRTT
jgi:tRNA (mo5U34)-methyltransferase